MSFLFTIQNVPIKLKKLKKWSDKNDRFTIQNVPIKSLNIGCDIPVNSHLQYKMFLLNSSVWEYQDCYIGIYNTKCSY